MTVNGILFWVVAVLATILVLGPLVIIHELGHFAMARFSKIRVLEFGLGFPPRVKVLGHDHETEYTLNALPIGGFCRMEGEDATSDDPRSFERAPIVNQIGVMVAGVVMNLIGAFLLFFIAAWLFNPVVQPRIEEVAPGYPAQFAGLQAGDSIRSINGQTFSLVDLGGDPWNGFNDYLHSLNGQRVTLQVVDAQGRLRVVDVTLVSAYPEQPTLGVSFSFGLAYTSTDPATAFGTAVSATGKSMSLIAVALGNLAGQIATNPTAGPTGVAGPVGIAAAVGHTIFDYGPILLLLLAAIISANLALLNILPIPPFDGGKVAIILIKRVFGVRGVSAYEIATNLIGFAALMVFLAWITYFDLLRIGSGG